MCKQPLIILTGPTAVGKTSLSIKLAKKIGAQIISADSMQVYRHMFSQIKRKRQSIQTEKHTAAIHSWSRTLRQYLKKKH